MQEWVFNRPLRVVFTALAFTGFYAVGAVLGISVLPLVSLVYKDPRAAATVCRGIVRRAFVFFHDYMRTTRLFLFDPREAPQLPVSAPYVLVVNHPTLVDVTAIMASYPGLVCVVKSALFRLPGVGRLLRCCGQIESERDGNPAAGAVVFAALERLRAGESVLIFPESTRSPEGGLGRFHRGAFEIAARARVPLVALVASCDPPMLGKSAPWYRTPRPFSRYRLRLLDVLYPADLATGSRVVARELEERYRSEVSGAGSPRREPIGAAIRAEAG